MTLAVGISHSTAASVPAPALTIVASVDREAARAGGRRQTKAAALCVGCDGRRTKPPLRPRRGPPGADNRGTAVIGDCPAIISHRRATVVGADATGWTDRGRRTRPHAAHDRIKGYLRNGRRRHAGAWAKAAGFQLVGKQHQVSEIFTKLCIILCYVVTWRGEKLPRNKFHAVRQER